VTRTLLARSTCSALLLTCSDFRFKSAERRFAEACGLVDDYDLVARPGAARSLVAPRSEAMRETLVEELRLLHGLHAFTRVLLVNHVSCRAYDDIASPQDEVAVHEAHLRAAVLEAQRLLPGVRAEAHLVRETGGDDELDVTAVA
jgi:hypothetical protein